MANIATMSVSLVTDVRRLVDGFKKAEKTAKTSIAKIKTVVSVLAGAAVFKKLTDAIGQAIERLDKLGNTAARLGVTVEALQEMRFVAEQNGIAIGNMETAMQRLGRRTDDAAKGTGEAVKAFQRLGLDAKALAKLSPDMIFQRIAQAMEGVANQNERIALAFKFFDTEGVQLLQAMQDGVRGIVELRQQAGEFGLVTSQDVRNAQLIKEQMNELNTIVSTSFSKAVADNTAELENFIGGLKIAVEAIVAAVKFTTGFAKELGEDLAEIFGFMRGPGSKFKQLEKRRLADLDKRVSREGTVGTPQAPSAAPQVLNPAAIAKQRGFLMEQARRSGQVDRFIQSRLQVISANRQAGVQFAREQRIGRGSQRAQFIENQRQQFLRREAGRRVRGQLESGSFTANQRQMDRTEAKRRQIEEAQLRELQRLNQQLGPRGGLTPAAGL